MKKKFVRCKCGILVPPLWKIGRTALSDVMMTEEMYDVADPFPVSHNISKIDMCECGHNLHEDFRICLVLDGDQQVGQSMICPQCGTEYPYSLEEHLIHWTKDEIIEIEIEDNFIKVFDNPSNAEDLKWKDAM